MRGKAKVFLVPVGLAKNARNAKLCAVGNAKLIKHGATLQYRQSEELTFHANPYRDDRAIKRRPYIFARYCDPATEKVTRPEFGKWLLNSKLPVAHRNHDLLDFRLENLEARETEKQKAVHKRAALKRAERERRSAQWEAKRAADHALRPEKGPDGLTPAQQVEKLCSREFQNILLCTAGRYVTDQMWRGTSEKPTDEMRAPELVARVTAEAIPYVKRGKVRNVCAYVYYALRTQAKIERDRIWAKLGHVTRPKLEIQTLTDLEAKQPERY